MKKKNALTHIPAWRGWQGENAMTQKRTDTIDFKGEHVTVNQIEGKFPSAAAAVYALIRHEGEKEMRRGMMALLWSAIAAGLSMSTSFIAKGILKSYLPDEPMFFPIVAMGYTMGFILVVTARQQLFTENTITPILPLMTKPSAGKLLCVLRLWSIVFAGNLIGGAVAALIFVKLPVFPAGILSGLSDIAQDMMRNTPWEMFAKGVLAGWLIATMVWVLASIEQAKILMIFLVTYLIALGGFTHIIVGSIEAMFLIFNHELNVAAAVLRFAIPTLLGNIVGGTCIFALMSHAQIRSDMAAAE